MPSLPAPEHTRAQHRQQQAQQPFCTRQFIDSSLQRKTLGSNGTRANSDKSRYSLQPAARDRLKFDSQEPVEMKPFTSKPFLKVVASRSREFREHLTFLRVHDDAADGHVRRAEQAPSELFGALASEAAERVLREIAGHCGSCPSGAPAKMRSSNSDLKDYCILRQRH